VILSDFMIVSLAVFSITYLVVYFDGPFEILWKIRHMCGVERVPVLDSVGQQVDIIEEPVSELAKFIKCHWCLTTWVSFVVSLAYVLLFGVELVLFPFLWLASISVSGLLHDCKR